ncbi:hypothetical protein DDF62_07195 [Caulobacter radicis]|uniref:hypothetical protein n=1 Tax=Caulobacter radicis TaxID=2172650 RepID=UPI000D56CF96|nr:hypothetical protein [Caulobacter radicis]PVM91404.1 hypothetical protein DDF62_07195 [Caulobacter radicis]
MIRKLRWAANAVALLGGAVVLSGCTFVEEPKRDAHEFLGATPADQIICTVNPDDAGEQWLSTAADQFRMVVSEAKVGSLSRCNVWLRSVPLYYVSGDTNITFVMDGCRVARSYKLVTANDGGVDVSNQGCGRRSDFSLVKDGARHWIERADDRGR